MAEKINKTYKFANGYSIIRQEGRRCNLIFRDKNHEVVALLEGCPKSLTAINPHHGRHLSQVEKEILQRFIKEQYLQINTEVADFLNLSILRQGEDEEYLTEQELKQKLAEPLQCQSLHVGKLRQHTLKIPSYSKAVQLNLRNAKIKKLVIGKNCNMALDLRDNPKLESVRVGENYNGSLLLSRSPVESILLDNNCRCDLSIGESRRCFNLIIADVYSGNLTIKNSCFHNITIGYYCYAAINLAQNWGRRAIEIGDSFRGELKLDDVYVYQLKLGKDCKGNIEVNANLSKRSSKEIYVADDFAGIMDLQKAHGTERIELGDYARGRINLLGNSGIKVAKFAKYFNGYVDFSNSSVEYVSADYGCSGNLFFNQCDNLIMLEFPRYKKSNIVNERNPIEVAADSKSIYYRYRPQFLPYSHIAPFYRKVFHNIRDIFS